METPSFIRRKLLIFSTCFLAAGLCQGADLESLERELRDLRSQNASLKAQVERQQTLIEDLARRQAELRGDPVRPAKPAEAAPLAARDQPVAEPRMAAAPPAPPAQKLGKVQLSGHGAIAYFGGQRNADFDKDVLRVDEAKLFLEAPLGGNTYFFSEVDVFNRDSTSNSFRAGELYLDFEGISRAWGNESQMSLRFGRVDIPFGEEYAQRDAVDNPLISHSVADFWGVDEGIEAYGSLGPLQYVAAIQNGGTNTAFDFASSKAATIRLGWDPAPGFHVSASGIRTGRIQQATDSRAEIWFGNDWGRRRTGSNAAHFWLDALQVDARRSFRHGHLAASAGRIRYRDDALPRRFESSADFGSAEGVVKASRQLHFGGRFSLARSPRGFIMPGDGLSSPIRLSEYLRRLSLGAGYQLTSQLLLKAEYSFNRGRWYGGAPRNQEDQVAAEATFKF